MSIKVFGAIFVLVASGLMGFKLSRAYTLQVHQLEQLIQSFEYIKCEMQYRMTSLTMQFQQCSTFTDGAISSFFAEMVIELESQINPNAGYCLNAVLGRMKSLSPAAAAVLRNFGQTLGCFDLRGQLICLEDTITYSQDTLKRLKDNYTNKTRNYQTLGLSAGAALIILFI